MLYGYAKIENPIIIEKFKMKCIPIATVLLATSLAGNALTLGKARGAAIVGRPLALSVSIHTAGDEVASASCFNAEVFYGDLRQEAQRVTVAEIAPTQDTLTHQIRITSSSPVNEPVVTVWVIAGCEQKTKRRFVFFADVESEIAVTDTATPPSPQSSPHSPVPLTRSNATSPDTKMPAALSMGSIVRETLVSVKPRLKITASARAKPRPQERKAAPVEPPQELLLGKRVDALAEWQSLNLTPETIQRRSEQLRLLENEMRALREAAQKNQNALNDVSAKLGQTQASHTNPLIVALGILSVLLAATLAYLLTRVRTGRVHGSPWWGDSAILPTDTPQGATNPAPSTHLHAPAHVPDEKEMDHHSGKTEPVHTHTQGPEESRTSDVDIDLDFDGLIDTVGGDTPLQTQTIGDAPHPAIQDRVPKTLNLREMMDVRQQAEFYMTLGQHDEAIHVLTETVHGDGNVNPLVYLDLLKLLYTLSRKSSFDQYREEFNRLFSGVVPEYALYTQAGQALEDYKEICEGITRRWPSQDAVVFIESQLIRQPQDAGTASFDLEAYRDLLMLHGMLKRMGGEIESDFAPFSTPKNSELSVLDQRAVEVSAPTIAMPDFPMDAGLTSPIEIDFDLSEQETKPGQIQMSEGPLDNMIDFDLSNLPGKAGSSPPKY